MSISSPVLQPGPNQYLPGQRASFVCAGTKLFNVCSRDNGGFFLASVGDVLSFEYTPHRTRPPSSDILTNTVIIIARNEQDRMRWNGGAQDEVELDLFVYSITDFRFYSLTIFLDKKFQVLYFDLWQ